MNGCFRFELRDVEVTWIIRDEYISATFFQSDVVEFFNKQIEQGRVEGELDQVFMSS